jgi:hypothetical protein
MTACSLPCPDARHLDARHPSHTFESENANILIRESTRDKKLCYIYREIDRIRRNDFNFSMSLVKRDCNTAAHKLAKLARVEGSVGMRFLFVPEQIRPSVWSDCNQLLNE